MLDIEKLTDAVLAGVQALLAKQTEPLIRQIESLTALNTTLEERLKALEQQEPAAPFDPAPIYQRLEELKELRAVMNVSLPELPDFGKMLQEAIEAIDPTEAIVEMEKKLAVVEALVQAIKMPDVVHGKDGASVVAARTNDDGELILKLSNGETLNAGKVVGQDGKDGLELKSFRAAYDGERSLILYLDDGVTRYKEELTLPIPIDRGVYKEELSYRRGDSVSWAGSMWVCQVDNPSGRPEQSSDWRLAVKRGRDAKPVVKA